MSGPADDAASTTGSTVVLLTDDLLFGSQAAAAAAHVGLELVTESSLQGAVQRCHSRSPKLVIADLSLSGLDPSELVASLKAAPCAPEGIIAYAPHVHQQKLSSARRAGCDRVLTRGQFHAELPELLRQVSATP